MRWKCVRQQGSIHHRPAAAFLVFFPRSTRARIIPPDLGSVATQIVRVSTRTDLPRGRRYNAFMIRPSLAGVLKFGPLLKPTLGSGLSAEVAYVAYPAAATALNYFAYNFIKIHRTLRTSPAMATGVTDRL